MADVHFLETVTEEDIHNHIVITQQPYLKSCLLKLCQLGTWLTW